MVGDKYVKTSNRNKLYGSVYCVDCAEELYVI